MFSIAPNFQTLESYVNHINQYGSAGLRPSKCGHCGKSGMRSHGSYDRKADRDNHGKESLNPVAILRFLCTNCKHTCSVLPECIPPHRWYLWAKQQIVLVLAILRRSFRYIATQVVPGRTSVSRWIHRFKEMFTLHALPLRSRYPSLGINADNFITFWKACLELMSLAHAMFLVHRSGEIIP